MKTQKPKAQTTNETSPPVQSTPSEYSPAAAAAPQLPCPFTDFAGLHKNILPHLSERTLRKLIREKSLPSIVLPNGRRRSFHVDSVISAMRRYQTGGH